MKLLTTLLLSFLIFGATFSQDYPILELDQPAPGFNLPGVDGKNYSLDDFDAEILVVIFTCNHCPTAQSYEDRIIGLVSTYKGKGVDFVAISPNDPKALRLDELGYTDLGDELEDMRIRAEYKGFDFPYLYDGEDQLVSKKYGPVATPHVFIFDKERKLKFVGRIDDSEDGITPDTKFDTRNAIDALLAGKTPDVQQTKTFGCSIKWSDKRGDVEDYYKKIYAEAVHVEMIDEAGIRNLIGNESENLRLINVWATWCGPCVIEFPDLVEMNFIYRHRGFELVTISADIPDKKEEVLKFLQKNHVSGSNYQFHTKDKYALIEAVDPDWQGALPYTILVKPGGEVLYAGQGTIDPLEIRRKIVDVLGRAKDW